MSDKSSKIYNHVLQLSIVSLTSALVWFSFVYYPKVINEYKTGSQPSQTIFKPVQATSQKFPIDTEAYNIQYEQASQTYYVFVKGQMLDVFEFNRQNAKLALKTALSSENLCNFSVIYVSTENLKVPQSLTDNSDC